MARGSVRFAEIPSITRRVSQGRSLVLLRILVASSLATLTTTGANQALAQSPDSLMARDTLTLQIGLTVPHHFSIPINLHREYLLLGQSIATSFVPPTRWELPLWPGTYTRGSDDCQGDRICSGLGLEGFLIFRITSAGRVQTTAFTGSRGAPGFAEALLAALHRADTAGILVAPAPEGVPRRDTTVVLEVRAVLEPPMGFVPLARLRLPARRLDSDPTVIEIPKPNYPSAQRSRLENGAVLLQYVITAEGTVDPTTLQVLYADDIAFAEAAIEVVLKGRFKPALASGRPAPVMVRQRVEFRIGID